MPDLRSSIKPGLHAFGTTTLRQASLDLLAILGYQSDKTVELEGSKPQAFLDLLAQSNPEAAFDKEKALFADWTSADLLFQLTDEELSGETSLFQGTDIRSGLLKSYLFFAIELDGASAVNGSYARGKLTAIARQINRVFPMPVMLLVKHPEQGKDVLSIAVINRRANKREAYKDVLGKVTIIRDISLAEPHRGHLDILDSFAVPNLRHPIHSFDTLHAAWEEIFNVELLNKRFYKELANWYFWALPQVDFPADCEPEDEKRRATGLIRLLTRLIFCWFIKEKGLVPEKLFHAAELKDILVDFDPASESDSSYYHAILQNLFFATLNQRMGRPKSKNAEPFRRFVTDKDYQGKNKEHGITNLYRYPNLFDNGQETAISHFEDIPFLNGGLFECLDKEDPSNKNRMLRIDGFTTNGTRPTIPNHLFFSDEIKGIDLSETYGDKKRKKESVSGLIRILNRYKFTIVENTPIDQEIALDPELLGKVFENLLASYNEETKTTARKQTGSFYTPRPIVDYMVDESLKAHLVQALVEKNKVSREDAEAGLDILFAYTEKEHAFSPQEIDTLIHAIDEVKILDPACGSGAFPMGVLHKLVFILTKLDPGNTRWKQRQLDAAATIPDSTAREAATTAIEDAFDNNEDDYGRKLYLIENCLYGVDIQPIAIQISKLRFFISLICDQKTNRDKAKNHGIRPLPNLETKFVAADTLIGLSEMDESLLVDPRVNRIEREIEALYHRHFSVQRRDQKLALQNKIRSLRKELGEILSESLMAPAKAQHVAEWDPFDPQASSDFFDPFWMFGPSLANGFDLVIGNPPYLKERDNKQTFYKVTATPWGKKHHVGKMDYWFFFLHRAFDLAKRLGVVSFITSRYWINSTGAKHLISSIQEEANLFHAVDIGSLPVFEAVAGHHMVHFYRVGDDQTDCVVKSIEQSVLDIADSVSSDTMEIWTQCASNLFQGGEVRLKSSSIILESTQTMNDYFSVSQGVVQNPDKVSKKMALTHQLPEGRGVFVLGRNERRYLQLSASEEQYIKPFYEDASIRKFHLDRSASKVLIYITKKNCPDQSQIPNLINHLEPFRAIMDARRETKKGTIQWFQMHWPRDPVFFESHKVAIPSMFDRPRAVFVEEPAYFGIGANVIIQGSNQIPLVCLSAFLNSSIGAWWFATNGKKRGVGVDIGVSKLRQFPMPKVNNEAFITLSSTVRLHQSSQENLSEYEQSAAYSFLEDLIDACVMECYFRDHMAERDLLFLDQLAPTLEAYNPNADAVTQRQFLESFLNTHNAPTAKIRNQLLRLTADSPDLLAIIKQEGRV